MSDVAINEGIDLGERRGHETPRAARAVRLIREAAAAWVYGYAPSMGAALSYYSLFSITPVLLIVISVAGYFFGEDAARGEIFTQLRNLMGKDGAAAVEGLLKDFSSPARSNGGPWSTPASCRLEWC